MYPYTAMSLKESKNNNMKDFLTAAGLFGVSHFLAFSQTENGNYLKLIKTPKGPTMTFKIGEYALSKDVIKHTQKNSKNSKIFDTTL